MAWKTRPHSDTFALFLYGSLAAVRHKSIKFNGRLSAAHNFMYFMLQIVSQRAHKHKSEGTTLGEPPSPRKTPTHPPYGSTPEERRRREHEFPRTSPKTHKFHKVAIQSINSDRGWPLGWTAPSLGHLNRYAHVHNHTTQTDFATDWRSWSGWKKKHECFGGKNKSKGSFLKIPFVLFLTAPLFRGSVLLRRQRTCQSFSKFRPKTSGSLNIFLIVYRGAPSSTRLKTPPFL